MAHAPAPVRTPGPGQLPPAATGLEIHGELIGYLLRKESEKLFAEGDDRTKALAKQAVQLTLDLVLGDAVPLEPQA